MIGVGLPKNPKRFFFDRKAVTSRLAPAKRKRLNMWGNAVRRSARKSLKDKPGASAPGQPPHMHVGLLKELLFYAFDPARESVVVGPEGLNRRDESVPLLLEEGGTVRRGKGIVTYRPRPYMAPALEMGNKQLPYIWANSIK